MIRILTESDITSLLTLDALHDVIADSIIAQYTGTVERPHRPHLDVGTGLEANTPLGTGLVMPAYIHGSKYFVTKLVGFYARNRDRELPTINAVIVLMDARTGLPVGILDGTVITNARTGCIGGLAANRLTDGPLTVGVIGAGAQARWQLRAIATCCPVEAALIYAPSDSRHRCAADLQSAGIPASAVDSSRAAVEDADVVVTATTSRQPVFPPDVIRDNAVVIAIGAFSPEMQELDSAVVNRAEQIFADVPAAVADTGDIQQSTRTESDLRDLGALLIEDVEPEDGLIIVESVGSAVFDAAAAEYLFTLSVDASRGTEVDF